MRGFSKAVTELHSLAIWRASSRVGESTRAAICPRVVLFSDNMRCSVGSKKASVLPVPVLACTRQSDWKLGSSLSTFNCTGVRYLRLSA